MDTAAEKDLVVLARQGDERAWEKLIEDSLERTVSLLRKNYALQPADIDEVVQVAMLKAWKKLDTFRSEASFVTWFYIILRNEAIDFIKKRNVIQGHELPAHFFTPEPSDEVEDYQGLTVEQTFEETAATLMEKRELLEAYRALIAEVLRDLSPPHSQIITLALGEGKTYKEISSELGIPMGTVMSRLSFARKEAQRLIIQYAKRDSIQLADLGRCK